MKKKWRVVEEKNRLQMKGKLGLGYIEKGYLRAARKNRPSTSKKKTKPLDYQQWGTREIASRIRRPMNRKKCRLNWGT